MQIITGNFSCACHSAKYKERQNLFRHVHRFPPVSSLIRKFTGISAIKLIQQVKCSLYKFLSCNIWSYCCYLNFIPRNMDRWYNYTVIYCVISNLLIGALSLQELAKGCGSGGKQCIGRPHDCIPTPKLCHQLAAITTLSASLVHVELRSKGHVVRNRWLAVGFSEDENMGRDAVIHCIQNGTFTEAQLTYNPEHLNIQGLPQAPVHVTEATMEDDGLHCSLDLDKKFLVQDQEFDLSTSHHLLFSTGPVQAGKILKHDKVPIISTEGYSF